MDSQHNLKPCPFCGCEDIKGPEEGTIGDNYSYTWVECEGCELVMEVHDMKWYEAIQEIKRRWNTRA